MFGTWVVTKVLCAHCAGEATPEIGAKLLIAKTRFQDPFSVTCDTGASYPNRIVTWAAAKTLFALPYPADGVAPKDGRATDTRLNCGGGPVARLLFLGNGTAIYLSEGEDYVLVRQAASSGQ
jgi:hypothetical protein